MWVVSETPSMYVMSNHTLAEVAFNASEENASTSLFNYTLTTPPTVPVPINWGVLSLTPVILATAIGNILVCLAVCWEKRLQNMTNYFLMSLAIADLLVSILVMPIGMVVELYGKSSYLCSYFYIIFYVIYDLLDQCSFCSLSLKKCRN